MSVAKKQDSLPQYSEKVGTNIDDKDEEVVDENGDDSLHTCVLVILIVSLHQAQRS